MDLMSTKLTDRLATDSIKLTKALNNDQFILL